MEIKTLLEQEVVITFVTLAVLLFSSYFFGTIFEKLKAPRVVGEIVGGMLWGSFLYPLFPEMVSNLFMAYEEQGKVLNIFYQLGLVFLMFLSGYNTKIELDKNNTKNIVLIFVGATIIPMLLGIPFIGLFKAYFIGKVNNVFSFGMVFTIGIAITSIPVISKIFFDMGIMNTRFSNIVLTVSTIQDLCLWVMLNVATRIATTGKIEMLEMLGVVFATIGLFVVIKIIEKHLYQIKREFKAIDFYTISFIVLLLISGILYKVGINIMYSSFLIGYIVKVICGKQKGTMIRMEALNNIVFSFFVPIYFSLVGIQLNILHNFSFVRFILFFIIAFGLEGIGTLIMLRISNFNKDTKINFAITMNARGGPGIVLATVAYSYEIINLEFFTVLILTTMLSSLIAGYWLRRQQKKDSNIFTNLME